MRLPNLKKLVLLSFLLTLPPSLIGCDVRETPTRGNFTSATLTSIHDLGKSGAGKTVQLTGVMVEKCPVAGCWFILKDETGTVRVDTKSAGFVVSDLPLQTKISVVGRVTAGDTASLSATGLQTP